MLRINATLPLRPKPKERARSRRGKSGHYTPNTTENAEIAAVLTLLDTCPEALGAQRYPAAAVWLDLWFQHATRYRKRWGRPHTFRPDKDNLEKLIQDALTPNKTRRRRGIPHLWSNDCIVAVGYTLKTWSEVDQIAVRATLFTEEELPEVGRLMARTWSMLDHVLESDEGGRDNDDEAQAAEAVTSARNR